MNSKLYDCLKWFCIICSPAICTLIVTLTNLWHWDIPVEAIVGTITAVTTFIGVVIGISNIQYISNTKEDEEEEEEENG